MPSFRCFAVCPTLAKLRWKATLAQRIVFTRRILSRALVLRCLMAGALLFTQNSPCNRVSLAHSVVTSLDIEGGRQTLLEAAPPSTPRGSSARPPPRLTPPPNERPLSGRPKSAVGGGPSAAVQAATAAIAASAALSRNPIFLECATVES